ncbi:MAG: glutamine-hydrolyzing carbamoyl-phosphate synthase small subunit [Flavobacteriales bacterium]|nr:glutamine-hydrolyzing carbamoyl-phosphate synthase small subunit [Flavobacteriales bacterium]
MKRATLLLEDGTRFQGRAIGAKGTTTGEIAFNTGMTGYQEIFTDPSYYGQVLVMNTSHIGNYGTHAEEIESGSIKIAGLVVKKFSEVYSRPSASMSIQDYLEKAGLVGISDIDTRALVRHIRDCGAMNALITSEDLSDSEMEQMLKETPSMDGMELSSKVSATEISVHGNEDADVHIALLDLGTKTNIIRCLTDRGCKVTCYPMTTSAEEILKNRPDGIMYTNGPGDPAAMSDTVQKVKSLVESGVPGFGICLGHQMIALSQGLKTRKMHHGHRGINHPVLNKISGKAEVTSQNHGFVVDEGSINLAENIEVTHVHLNDDSIAGIRLKDRPVFSVQYHPEANPGPHDSRYLFDQFVEAVKENKKELITSEQ